MCSTNVVDFIAEKILSLSSKMRDDSLDRYSTSFLVSGKDNSHQWDPLKVLNVFKENSNSFYPRILKQEIGILDFNHSFKFHHNLKRSEYSFSRTKNGLFSARLLDLISNLNAYHCRNIYADLLLALSNNIFFGNIMNNLFNESSKINLNSKTDFNSSNSCNSPVNKITMPANIGCLSTNSIIKSSEMRDETALSDTKVCSSGNAVKLSLVIGKLPTDSIIESSKRSSNSEVGFNSDIKTCRSPINTAKMSLNISQSSTNKKDLLTEKCYLPTNVKLNLKLANRKTKQMNKRSKKRRRRMKKSHLGTRHSNALLDSGSTNEKSQPVSSMCFFAKSPDFECKISFHHNVQVSSFGSSVLSAESNSDDSDWESFDDVDNCKPNDSTSASENDCEVLTSLDSSPVKNKESKYSSVPNIKFTSHMSFVIPVSDSSDDDSDWDCEPDTLTETSDFEFTGLFFSGLCTPQAVNAESKVADSSEDETEECLQLKKLLSEANKNWNNLAGDTKLKLTSKVTFAPDKDLVEVFPVEIYDRKGEWEMYATERLRFKKKIDELEKVLSPCFQPEHRVKVFKKLMESKL